MRRQTPLNLPPVDKDALPATCRAIWDYVVRALHSTGLPVEARSDDGEAGYIYHGSLSGIIGALWPDSAGSGRHDAEAVHVRTATNVYLSATHNMRCLDRGYQSRWAKNDGRNRPPVWWVRQAWSSVPPVIPTTGLSRRERGLTRRDAGEDREHAPVTVRKIAAYPCLDGCGRSFADLRGQSYHVRYHTTHRRLVEHAVRILRANGGNVESMMLAEVAEGIVHPSSLHRHFASKEILAEEAFAHMATMGPEQGQETIDETSEPSAPAVPPRWTEFKTTLLEAIAYMHHLGIPMTLSGVMAISGTTRRPQRSGALAQLIGTGEVLQTTQRDYRGRSYQTFVPRIPWAPPVLVQHDGSTAAPLDPRTAIEQLMAEYDRMTAEVGRLTAQIADTAEITAQQGAVRMAEQVRMEQLTSDLDAANARFAKVREFLA